MPNIELKARCPDLARLRARALALGASPLWDDRQRDTYFATRAGKLKLRESGLNGAELLPYLKSDRDGIKRSDYARLPSSEPALTRELLGRLLGESLTVSKRREALLLGNVRIHLDQVEGLGEFVELEAVFDGLGGIAQAEAERARVLGLMGELGIEATDLLEGSYPELLRRSDPRRHFEAIYSERPADYHRLVSCEDYPGNLRAALRRLLPERCDRVVELGAGTGRVTDLLCERALEVTAFDAAPAMLETARLALRERHPRPGHWRLGVADNRSLPYPAGLADAAVAGWTLGHLTEWHPDGWEAEVDRAVAEMERVTRPGGAIVVIETLGTLSERPSPPTPALAAYYERLERRHGFGRESLRTDYRFESVEEAARILGFFFGDGMAREIRRRGDRVVPECTGVWRKTSES